MIKTVIFDLDGLLVNSELMTYEFYKRILAEKGTDFTLTLDGIKRDMGIELSPYPV